MMNYNDFGQRIDYVEYIVKKGDSLYTIAKKYDTTVASLTDINMLTSNAIFPGQILLVPKGSNKETDYYFENYVVNPGDTIEIISTKLGVDPVLLGMYNDFAALELKDNQVIKIPRNDTYTVKQNDTVDSIISTTNRSAEQILKANANTWLKADNKILL